MQPSIVKPTMSNGLIMGVLFSVNFLLSIQKNYFFVFLSYFVIASIVVSLYKMSIQFRDSACAGVISYRRAFFFIHLLFCCSHLFGRQILLFSIYQPQLFGNDDER